ncbi:MAG: response regulator [Deltaproteobacteria bacterium]
MVEQLMDIKETAKYLKMNKMTVYKLARENRIPAFKIASEWRFKRELIDQWLMNQLKGKKALKDLHLQPAETRKTVLVVDDDELTREFFKRLLDEYTVLTAASGEEAIYLVKKGEAIDLVLLDIKMPGIDGIETLRQMKSLKPGISVVMISAHGTLKTNVEAAKLGALDSIAKPFDLEEMKSVIKGAVEKKEPSGRNAN